MESGAPLLHSPPPLNLWIPFKKQETKEKGQSRLYLLGGTVSKTPKLGQKVVFYEEKLWFNSRMELF